MPESIWSGAAIAKGSDAYTTALKNLKRPDLRELTYSAGVIYSFHDLRALPLSSLVEPGTIEENSTEAWAKTNNANLKGQFIELLKRSFRQFCFAKKIFFDAESELLYCGIDRGKNKREVKCPALQNEGTRTLVNWYPSKKEGLGFYRHHAISPRFVCIKEVWYIEVTPTYFFTSDGSSKYRFSEDSLAGIKRLEKHRAVLGHLLMWKWLFCDKSLLFDRQYDRLELAEPLKFKVSGGIDDAAWLKAGCGEDNAIEFVYDEEDDVQGILEL